MNKTADVTLLHMKKEAKGFRYGDSTLANHIASVISCTDNAKRTWDKKLKLAVYTGSVRHNGHKYIFALAERNSIAEYWKDAAIIRIY